MKWINIEQELPPEEEKPNTLWFDVFTSNGYRLTSIKFEKGKFFEQILDGDGDYSHDEELVNVTHWLYITDP